MGKSNPFKSTLKANEIKLLTDCVNEANMFTTTVSAKILTDFFNCKLNGVLKVNNTRLLAYLMMQLSCYNYIVYEWQSVRSLISLAFNVDLKGLLLPTILVGLVSALSSFSFGKACSWMATASVW